LNLLSDALSSQHWLVVTATDTGFKTTVMKDIFLFTAAGLAGVVPGLKGLMQGEGQA